MTSKWLTSLISATALAGFTLTSALPATAAEQAPSKNGPGVARVSILDGQAVVQRGDSGKQVTATVNAPLLPGDYISTGTDSRAEVQLDGTAAVRLGGGVQARITANDPNNRQLQLADGTIELGLVRNGNPVSIDTPSITVRAHEVGDYRVTIGKDGSSWVTARRGRAEVLTSHQTYALEPGRTLVARGSASDPSISYASEVGDDSFDDFNIKRDQTMIAAIDASPNVNPNIAGYDDLGAYGQWQDVPGYGQSWVPDQSQNWSPYGNGNWTWGDGYGWTWVGSEPWGWAPYHYGNWYYANGYGWAWLPPAYAAAPAWSPALVGFFGFGASFGGPGWGVSLGFGGPGYGGWGYPNIGWYPIAPYTPFYPWWPGWGWTGLGWGWGGYGGGCCYGGFGTNVVNVTNITNITNINRAITHGGVHGTSVSNFQHGTVAGHTFGVNQHNIGTHVGMIHGAVPVTPTRNSLGFGGGAVHDPVSMSKAFDSPRFASANRALAGRMSFDRQQKAVAQAIRGNSHQTNAPASHENSVQRGNAMTHASAVTHGNAMTQRQNATERDNAMSSRSANAPTSSWQRFNQDRGITPRDSNQGRMESNAGRADSGSSWSRSNGRGAYSSSAYGDRGGTPRSSYGSSYSRGEYGNSHSRGSEPSYSRGSYPSYSRQSYPSYSRQSYPSYARPSYSRDSYPSYARPSYQSPGSYYRGGGGAPAYSRGGGGGYAPHPSGGGGGGGGGGGRGRPPR
jgi:FecR protein